MYICRNGAIFTSEIYKKKPNSANRSTYCTLFKWLDTASVGYYDHLINTLAIIPTTYAKTIKPSALPAVVARNRSLATTCLYPAPESIWEFSTICSKECRKEQSSYCPQIHSNPLMGALIPAYAPKSETWVTRRHTGVRIPQLKTVAKKLTFSE